MMASSDAPNNIALPATHNTTPVGFQRGVMKLLCYNGDDPPEIYLIQVQLAVQFNNWSAEETAVQVALALEGKALQILTDLQPQERLSWPAREGATTSFWKPCLCQ